MENHGPTLLNISSNNVLNHNSSQHPPVIAQYSALELDMQLEVVSRSCTILSTNVQLPYGRTSIQFGSYPITISICFYIHVPITFTQNAGPCVPFKPDNSLNCSKMLSSWAICNQNYHTNSL